MASESQPDSPKRKRPLGVTLLALAMAWLALAAFGNTAVILLVKDHPFPGYFALLTAAYGIAAAATTTGLWRMKSWTLIAFRSWGLTCLAFFIALSVVDGPDGLIFKKPEELLPLFFTFLAIVLLLFWLLDRYIRSRVGRSG